MFWSLIYINIVALVFFLFARIITSLKKDFKNF